MRICHVAQQRWRRKLLSQPDCYHQVVLVPWTTWLLSNQKIAELFFFDSRVHPSVSCNPQFLALSLSRSTIKALRDIERLV